MGYRYKQLVVFQEAKRLHTAIFKLTSCLLPHARYLADQIRRAALSVALNIAEGAGKTSTAEFKRYVSIALGSINEVFAALEIASDIKLLTSEQIASVQQDGELLKRRLGALRRSLNNNIQSNKTE